MSQSQEPALSSIFPTMPRKLADVAPDGTKFYQEHPDQLPLSARLQRLWGERGDFSRFSVKRLKLDPSADGDAESDLTALKPADLLDDDEERGDEAKSNPGGATAPGASGAFKGGLNNAATAAGSAKASLTIREMTQLKADMLSELQAAHHSLYLAHALVSMVLNTRSTVGGAPGTNGVGPNGTRANSTFSRAESPQTAASRTAKGTNQSTAPLGSAAAIESELGLEADALGVSFLDQRRAVAREAHGGDEEDEANDAKAPENPDEEESRAERRRKRLLARDEKRSVDEVDEETREAALALMGKKQGMANAVAILRRGAEELEKGQSEDDERWEALRGLRSKGWGITPGNPSGTLGGEVEGPRRVAEGERDAWIGFGLPEAGPAYRARSLAYLISGREKEEEDGQITSTPPPKPQLKFVTPRTGKRIRLSIVDVNSGQSWSSSSNSSSSGEVEEKAKMSLDDQLKDAQEEMADLELFDSLSREARQLNAQGVANARVKDGHVVVSLHAGCELRLELSEPFSTSSASSATASTSASDGPDPAEPGRSTSPTSATSRIADLVLAVLRLWALKRDQRMSALERVLGWAHYTSFVDGLRKSLARLDDQEKGGSREEGGEVGKGKVEVQLGSAAGSVRDVATWIAELAPCDALGGTGRVLFDGAPLALVTLSFPSNLNVSLLPTISSAQGLATDSGSVNAPARSLDVDGTGLLEVLRLAVDEARQRGRGCRKREASKGMSGGADEEMQS